MTAHAYRKAEEHSIRLDQKDSEIENIHKKFYE